VIADKALAIFRPRPHALEDFQVQQDPGPPRPRAAPRGIVDTALASYWAPDVPAYPWPVLAGYQGIERFITLMQKDVGIG